MRHALNAWILVVCVALLLAPSGADATTRLDRQYGTPVDQGNGAAAAMGSAGVSRYLGSASLIHNPAMLAQAPSGFALQFQLGISQASEDRSVPLFDSFDSFVNDTVFATNRTTSGLGEGGVVFGLSNDRRMALSVGIFERYDSEYDYIEEIRDPDPDSTPRDRILSFNQIKDEGKLRSVSAGYATELLANDDVQADLGFSAHRYYGTLESFTSEAPLAGSDADLRVSRDLTGWGWSVGTHVNVRERVSVGVSFEAPVKLNGAHDSRATLAGAEDPTVVLAENGDYDLEYPSVLNVGATYRPRNELRTSLTVQATRRFWDSLTDDFVDATNLALDAAGEEEILLDLQNTWDLRMGVEHTFYNGTPIRFGFRYLESYADRESDRSIFSAGVGHVVEDVVLDLTVQFHRQTSFQDYVFDASTAGFSVEQTLHKVEDSVFRVLVGVSRQF